jgi:hypothetical protein
LQLPILRTQKFSDAPVAATKRQRIDAPWGLPISSGLGRSTGDQEIVYIHKMGNRRDLDRDRRNSYLYWVSLDIENVGDGGSNAAERRVMIQETA